MNILSFGEVLWDVFDRTSVIGGAPFNFSAHMARLGADVDLVTAVGRDALGSDTVKSMKEQGVSASFVCLSDFPTGACYVTVDRQGRPAYDLHYNMAYDHIVPDKNQWEKLCGSNYQAFYFGTLARRSEDSNRTVSGILSSCRFDHVLYDVNIRQKWYSKALLAQGLHACTILKVSREEAGAFFENGLAKTQSASFTQKDEYYRELCRELAGTYQIAMILLTLDQDGAIVYDTLRDAFYISEKPKGKVVSTVGAGDSFAACFLYHFLKGDPTEQCLNKAVLLSDYVVGRQEAVPPYTHSLLEQLKKSAG